MSEDLNDFFSSDPDNWNYYNEFLNKPGVDPYNDKRKLYPFGYNLMKYNCVIMLKAILKHTKQYLENDIIEWIIKKALLGSENDYWEILSITKHLFYYCLFRTDKQL
jgi:hypothetical protein